MTETPEGGTAKARPVIDFHAHVLVPDVYAVAAEHNIFSELPTDPGVTEAMRDQIRQRAGMVLARMSDLTDRIAKMDAMGVDIQVLTASLVHQGLEWADAQTSLRLARTTNDWIAAAVALASRPADRARHAAAARAVACRRRTGALHARAWVARGRHFVDGWRARTRRSTTGTILGQGRGAWRRDLHSSGRQPRPAVQALPSLEQRRTGVRGGDGSRVADLRRRARTPSRAQDLRLARWRLHAVLHGPDRSQLHREGQHARQHDEAADRISAHDVLRFLRL